MDDFASAAMMKVLDAGLRRLGLEPPPAVPAGAAHVRLDQKRAAVAAAVAQGGLACLPRLGAGVHAHADDPTHRALAAARDGHELLARWRRLERYIHSAHRTEVTPLGPGAAAVAHLPRAGGPPPSPAEDLVVLGVLGALLEAIGASCVDAAIDGVSVLPAADEAALARLAAAGRTGRWTLRWVEGPRGSGDGGDRPREGRTDPPPRRRRAPSPAHAPGDLCDRLDWPGTAHRCAALWLADPLSPPALADAAASLGLSARALQRALAAHGLSWSSVTAEARVRAAAWWLLETDRSIAECGFLAGYSDQPHFTRDFGRRIGLAPGRYREHFARRG